MFPSTSTDLVAARASITAVGRAFLLTIFIGFVFEESDKASISGIDAAMQTKPSAGVQNTKFFLA